MRGYDKAMDDLNTVLHLRPNHFGALVMRVCKKWMRLLMKVWWKKMTDRDSPFMRPLFKEGLGELMTSTCQSKVDT